MRHCPRCSTSYGDDVPTCPLDGTALSSAPRPDPLLNRIIKGRYRIVGKLGDGGMGAVYRAEQLSVGRTVALKVLHREFARDEEFVQRFQQEARLAAALNHPRLTTVFDFDQSEDGSLFIVMEYLEGTLLSDLIRRAGPLDIARAVRLAIQIAEGVDAAHAAGVIHRDIKPQNIVVLAPGDSVKLMDFGIARLNDGRDVQLTRAGTLMGTPLYMAPEQIEGRTISEKTDIYAFGVVVYEMLSGQTPFTAPTSAAVLAKQLNEPARPLRTLRPDVSPRLEQIVMQALEKEPEFRQDSVADIVRRLRAIAGMPEMARDDTQVSAATMVVGATRSSVAAGDAETMMATPTMVSGRAPDPVGTSARVPAPAPMAVRKSRWTRLREGYGKAIAISAGIVIVVIAATLLWWMTRPGSLASVVKVPSPETIPRPTPPPVPSPETMPAPTPRPALSPETMPRPTPRPETGPAGGGRIPSVTAPFAPPKPQPSTIKTSVEQKLRAAELLRNPDSDGPGVTVEMVGVDGDVRLVGVLRDAAEIQKAAKLAREVDGVRAVNVDRVNPKRSWESQ